MTLNEDNQFSKLDLSRKKALLNNLPMAYNEELPITNEKKKISYLYYHLYLKNSINTILI